MTAPVTNPADDLQRLRGEYIRRSQEGGEQEIYSLFSPGHLYMIQQRQRDLLALLRYEGVCSLSGRNILEVGCGSGGVLREFLSYGAEPDCLHGVELLDFRLARARVLSPHLPLLCADAQRLPYRDAHFDLVLQFTVFTSILDDAVKRNIATEMRRVLKPDGLIVWYDFWLNPTNRQTKAIRPREVRTLFPEARIRLWRITLAPPIARRLATRSWLACHILERLKLFNTHYLAAIRPALAS